MTARPEILYCAKDEVSTNAHKKQPYTEKMSAKNTTKILV